jgi:hypothetical protein
MCIMVWSCMKATCNPFPSKPNQKKEENWTFSLLLSFSLTISPSTNFLYPLSHAPFLRRHHLRPHTTTPTPLVAFSLSVSLSAFTSSTLTPKFNCSNFDHACLKSSMKLDLWMSINSGDCNNLISLPFSLLVEYQTILFCFVFNFCRKMCDEWK